MREDVFRQRLKLLKSYGFNVLGLDEALTALDNSALPPKAVVITADDGYCSTPHTLSKACAESQFPLTIYVTSYYAEKQNPIFNVMVQYLFWKTERHELTGDLVFAGINDTNRISLDGNNQAYWANFIIDYGRKDCDEHGRERILIGLCKLLAFNYQEMKSDGFLMLMDAKSIAGLAEQGVDLQLHTHRHRFPVKRESVIKEIEDNRAFLEPLVGKSLKHFCYPSGIWDAEQHPWMKQLAIESATTCQLGFVTAWSDRLALNRYLDRDDISENEFLAEASGFLMLARRCRKKVKRLWL